jgi:hypothetical protein
MKEITASSDASRRQGEMVPVAQFDRQYAVLSHMAHPSMFQGTRFLRLVDAADEEVWRGGRGSEHDRGMLTIDAHNSARRRERRAPVLGVHRDEEVRDLLTSIEGMD